MLEAVPQAEQHYCQLQCISCLELGVASSMQPESYQLSLDRSDETIDISLSNRNNS